MGVQNTLASGAKLEGHATRGERRILERARKFSRSCASRQNKTIRSLNKFVKVTLIQWSDWNFI